MVDKGITILFLGLLIIFLVVTTGCTKLLEIIGDFVGENWFVIIGDFEGENWFEDFLVHRICLFLLKI